MIELNINNNLIKVPNGLTIIEVALKNNIYIPNFCYHKELSLVSSCRMCLVEVSKFKKIVPACSTIALNGMMIYTKSKKVIRNQRAIMEFLLINHPLDCPVCDKGGECKLQNLTIKFGKSYSRYYENKRIVLSKDVGSLISMEEMSRCIHCTKCIRFGKEIAGVTELGMINRGEKSEITTFFGNSINSELSGNMIDLCPVGAITSKPFRYTVRSWELCNKKSISPHDSVGSNITVQVKNNYVMRVLPYKNNLINGDWISDKDRFSYDGLNSIERFTNPMLKKNNVWVNLDWNNIVKYIRDSLYKIIKTYGNDSIAILCNPLSTLEELFLLKKISEVLNIRNIDFRLRQHDFFNNTYGSIPWLGSSICDLSNVGLAFVIGSSLRFDHPIFALRLRNAERKGSKVIFLHYKNDNTFIKNSINLLVAPSLWLNKLIAIAKFISIIKKKDFFIDCGFIEITEDIKKIAFLLCSNNNVFIFLGNDVVQHKKFSYIHAIVQWISNTISSRFGFLTESSNTIGAHFIKFLPKENKLNIREMFNNPKKCYILFNIEPEFDLVNSKTAISSLNKAELVIMMNPFLIGKEYADVLLPISPFTETKGLFINAEGRIQSFDNVVHPLKNTKPAWKILCMLGKYINRFYFNFENIKEIRNYIFKSHLCIKYSLSNKIKIKMKNIICYIKNNFYNSIKKNAIERITETPIYYTDQIVRRSKSLNDTYLSKFSNFVRLSSLLFDKFNLKNGDVICVTQNNFSIKVPVICDNNLADTIICIPSTLSYNKLGDSFGELFIKKCQY